MGLSREKKLNQSFAVEIVVQNRRLIFGFQENRLYQVTPHPQVSAALLTYDACAQLGIADEVLVSVVSASELLRPGSKIYLRSSFLVLLRVWQILA